MTIVKNYKQKSLKLSMSLHQLTLVHRYSREYVVNIGVRTLKQNTIILYVVRTKRRKVTGNQTVQKRQGETRVRERGK